MKQETGDVINVIIADDHVLYRAGVITPTTSLEEDDIFALKMGSVDLIWTLDLKIKVVAV